MNGQLDLLEYARSLRDTGMARAQQAQGPEWSELAYAAIERVARRQVHVHIDDILQEGVPQPRHHNCWGAVWMRAIRSDVIQPTAIRRQCTVDPRKHAHQYPVYFSLIHDPRS